MILARYIITGCLLLVLPLSVTFADTTTTQSNVPWEQVTNGLDLARFAFGAGQAEDSVILILRIDPEHFELRAYCLSESERDAGQSIRDWVNEHSLIAGINAGMYLQDHSTHVGYLKSGDHINNPTVVSSDYRSVAAYGPRNDSLPPFRIFDLDETDIDSAITNYELVVQNIRLIKRPAKNRWPKGDKRWSEAALGEDAHGNMLFLFSRTPMTMHDFNEILLGLPINIIAAQHLEGGPEAQLYLRHNELEIELVGEGEDGFIKNNNLAWPVPNILGISPRP